MVIFDTNVFIYAGNGSIDISKLEGLEACYASISMIEALGFQQITAAEQRALQRLFEAYENIDLSQSIIEEAIKLRQNKKMSLGDSIIAATALEHDLTLWTANTDDFRHIEGLKLLNPLQ
jgi:predicted nucleic acid-binding protein